MGERSRFHILLVEDNPADVLLLRESLDRAGLPCHLTHLDNGESVLNFLHDVPPPDLMLLDLNVPKRNGEEVLRALREDDRFKDLPVVVVSSSDSPRDRNVAAALGVRQYITKPLRLSEYLEIGNKVKALLAHA